MFILVTTPLNKPSTNHSFYNMNNKKLKWISNIANPRPEKSSQPLPHKIPIGWCKNDKPYLVGKVLGKPRPTDKWTSQELERMGLVGIYEELD